MYVILTSKPGQFRTEISEGLKPCDAYDYMFYGVKKAHFVIAELVRDDTRIRVVEDGSGIVNNVPCKFLEKFESRERAFEELEHLTTFGHMETSLRKAPTTAAA